MFGVSGRRERERSGIIYHAFVDFGKTTATAAFLRACVTCDWILRHSVDHELVREHL
jgi:hypothetical protein